MTVGLLLASVAIFLVFKNSNALLGRSISLDQERRVVELLQKDPVIGSVENVKTIALVIKLFVFCNNFKRV